jgi:WD40 repeat protein/tRNA A-37 threonylcarbamoyl transferase component Bud32
LDALLRAHDHPNSALERPLAAPPPPSPSTVVRADPTGAVIGDRYKLLEKIGEGGMGEVWVADQLDPIKRRVALKLIKPGMDTRSVLGRFEAERQALAVMDHPNIAKVLDAGTTAEGRPFFVMELVKGTPITQFCDIRKLTPRERLELFVPVCQAIQHAHTKGVIHRDIKPGNVLVELYDDRAVPKVIDFGVAKAVGQQLTDKTIYTGFGALVGTPAYMAPEQATFNALDVDTRADVYALGVLLYELLAGSPPFSPERLKRAALDEMLRVVREEEPPRPSTRLSTSESKATIAATRQSDPDALARLVRGELDWIVMKALEKDRTRRYETANGFAADIQRFLAGEQVQAVPPSLGYRVAKVYSKNRAAVWVAAAFVGLVVGAAVMGGWLALQARKAELVAKENEQAAMTASAVATDAADAARREKDAATVAREDLRRVHYATSMNLAQAAWDGDNVQRLIELLDEQRPKPGEADLRGFEWHHWHKLAHADLRTWAFHSGGELVGAALSPDGRRAGTWSFDEAGGRTTYRLRVLDTGTGKEIFARSLPRGDAAAFVEDGRLAFSRDGRRLAFTHRVKNIDRPTLRVVVFDVDDGTEVFGREGYFEPKTALSADGTRLGVVLKDDGQAQPRANLTWAAVHVWNLTKPDDPPVRIENDDRAASLVTPSFSPDGSRLASITWKGLQGTTSFGSAVHVWDTTTGKRMSSQSVAGEFALALAVRPDGRSLVTVGTKTPGPNSKDRPQAYLTLWRIGADGNLAAVHTTHAAHSLSSVPHIHFAFSADGNRLALSNGFQPALLFDLETGSNLRAIKSTSGIMAAAFSPNGTRLLTLRNDSRVKPGALPDGTLQEWDVTPTARRPIRPAGRVEVWNADDSRRLWFDQARRNDLPAGVWAPGKEIAVKDRDGKILHTFTKHTSPVFGAVFSPDGKWVLSHSQAEAMLWRVESGEVGWTYQASHDTQYPAVSWTADTFSPDGRWIALRDGAEHRVVAATDLTEKFRTGPTVQVRFSPDGRRLVGFRRGPPEVGGGPKTGEVLVWEAESGKPVHAHPWPDGYAWPAVFSPDGRLFAVAGVTTVEVFDAATGTPRCSMPPEPQLGRIAFSPDGMRMVMVRRSGVGRNTGLAGPDAVTVWDTATGHPVYHLKGHPSPIRDVAFSPDGRRIATAGTPIASPEGEVRVWDAATGRGLLTLPSTIGFFGGDVRLAFSPDGHRLALQLTLPTPIRHPLEQVWDATPRSQEDRP